MPAVCLLWAWHLRPPDYPRPIFLVCRTVNAHRMAFDKQQTVATFTAAILVVFLLTRYWTHTQHIEGVVKALGSTTDIENPRFQPSSEESRLTGSGLGLMPALSVVTKRAKLDKEGFFALARTSLEQPPYPYLAAKAPPSLPSYFKYMERELLPSQDQGECGSCWACNVPHLGCE